MKKLQKGDKLIYKTSNRKYKVKQEDLDGDGIPDTYTERRTLKGFLSGAPKGKGRMYKSGGKLKSSNKTRKKK
jgi:hypothetical protein